MKTHPPEHTYRTLSIHEYRLSHPYTSEVQTLTQGSLIHGLMERRQRRAEKLQRRKELQKKLLAMPGRAMSSFWMWVSALMPQRTVRPAAPVARPSFAKFEQPARMGV